jgi:hypothetical protein
MARLKTYHTKSGTSWSVWCIEASIGRDVTGMPRTWLLFQDEEGTERRRLVDFPATWESLSDERLELLCRLATPSKNWSRPSPPGGVSQIEGLAEVEADDE